jgi:hypothetical protein
VEDYAMRKKQYLIHVEYNGKELVCVCYTSAFQKEFLAILKDVGAKVIRKWSEPYNKSQHNMLMEKSKSGKTKSQKNKPKR